MNTMFSTQALRLAYGKTLMDDGSSLITSDGYTYELPHGGYMVGGLAGETRIPLDICESNLFHSVWLQYAKQARKLIEANPSASYAVGTWVNKGCIVFDVSERIASSKEAGEICVDRGEDAFYDVDRNISVTVLKPNK